jgi:hypothetical protein
MKVKMLQQLSGTRGDGSPWPAPGAVFDTSGEEFEWLTHTAASSPHPIAVPVAEEARKDEPKTETRPAPADPQVETRAEPEPESAGPLPWDEDEPVADAPPAKRGPGRPRKDSLPK